MVDKRFILEVTMRATNVGEGRNSIVEQWYVLQRHLTQVNDMAYHESTCAAV